jgi:hypothetical protein
VSINVVNRRIIMTPALASGGTTPLGLQTNLAVFWEFENTSWLDSTGNITGMTPHGTTNPSVVTGKVGNAVQIDNSGTQFLDHASDSHLDIGGGDFSFMYWGRMDSFNSANAYTRVAATGGGQGFQAGAHFTSSQVYFFSLFANGENLQINSSTSAVGSWDMIVCTYTFSTKSITINVNNGATIDSAGPMANALGSDAGATFSISDTTTHTWSFDQMGIWKGRILSTSDINLLWNGGNGLTYAQML